MANKKSLLKLSLIGLVGFAIFLVVSESIFFAKTETEKVIKQEFIVCLSAVCLNKKAGETCVEMNPTIARIILAEDRQNPEAKRIIIESSNNKSCASSK